MGKNRIEAFSDGVLAIIITIMVLEMKVPHGTTFDTLTPLIPVFMSYVLSFIYVGIYWNNHHHMFHAVHKVGGGVMWANLHLLFWLSLIPFVTGWMGENHFDDIPTACYGFVLLMSALAYYILQRTILHTEGKDSLLAKALDRDFKGKISPVIYIVGMVSAFYVEGVSFMLYALAALLWLVPDKRIEKMLGHAE